MTSVFRVLLDASIRISLVAIAVYAAIYLLRIHASSLRHKAWLGVLLTMFLMPILPRMVPRLEVGLTAPTQSMTFEAPPADTSGAAGSAFPASLKTFQPKTVEPSTSGRTGAEMLLVTFYVLYALGALILLGRFLAGWRFSRRLSASGRPIAVRGMAAYECAGIATPLTVGLIAPRILLPAGWSDWREDKITAVLAHEAAHVRRRDTLTNFLAHLNQVVFWFHPLAWWLQRRLALDAEHACDDAAVLALGESRKYTEVLLDIAQTASRRGGTLALHGVGVDGAGLLGPRIDRLARGVPAVRATHTQMASLAITCGIAVFFVAACQQKSLPELKADPNYAQQIAGSIARNNRFQEINRMTATDAEALEAKVLQNPDDGEAREKLMAFYQSKGRQVLRDERTTKGFWTIKLWCIEHHPEDPCAALIEPLFDPAFYQRGAKVWESILRRPEVTADLRVNAVVYFRRADPKRAEEIAEGGSIDAQKRTRLLSSIYTFALDGPSSQTPYAEDLRKRLDQSTDAALLSETGFSLARLQPLDSPSSILGHRYIARAAELDPASVNRDDLARMERNQAAGQGFRQTRSLVGDEVSEAQYQKASALPADERARLLPNLAEKAYWAGASLADYNHDPEGARRDWVLARKYAKDALAIEESFRNDPNYGNRVYKADIILAMVALRADGNHKEARNHLRAAAPITTDDNWFPATLKFLVLLLRNGNAEDRAAVIEFCELHSKTVRTPGVDLIQSVQKLRQGVMPTWYQYEVTQFKQ